MSMIWGPVLGEYRILRFDGDGDRDGDSDIGSVVDVDWRCGGGDGGGGGRGLEAGQHQELSGDTMVVGTSFRCWWWLLLFWVEAEMEGGAIVMVEVEVEVAEEEAAEEEMVVSRQRRRLGLMGWVWNLRWAEVAAIWYWGCNRECGVVLELLSFRAVWHQRK